MTEAQSPKPAPAAYRRLVRTFIKEHIEPVEVEYLRANQAANPGADHRTWQVLPVVEELNHKAVVFRRILGQQLHLRTVPKLTFVYDEVIERGAALSQLIDNAVKSDLARHRDDENDDEAG